MQPTHYYQNISLESDWFFEAVNRYFSRIAIVDYTNSNPIPYSYAEIHQIVNQYCDSLQNTYKLQLGDKIGIIDENRMEHLFLLLACLRMGYVFVPMNFRLVSQEIQYQLQKTNPKLLFYGNGYLGNAIQEFQNMVPEIIELNSFSNSVHQNLVQSIIQPQRLDPELPLIVLFTSGTTGKPKAALLSRRMILWNNIQTIHGWSLDTNDSTIIHTPFFHAGGLNVLTTPLLFMGGKSYLTKGFHVDIVLKLVQEKKINLLFAVPTMYQLLIDHIEFEQTDFSYLKIVISGGAPCPKHILDTFRKKGVNMRQGFGMTEVGVNCFYINVEDVLRKPDSVGKPMIFSSLQLFDDNGQKIESDGTGTLYLNGPHLFSGYIGISKEETFDPKYGFNSGDIAKRDEEGFYYITGRKKDIIIRGGENIYPLEVEMQINLCNLFQELSVVGKKDSFWGEIPVLIVSMKKDCTFDKDLFYEHCKKNLASYKIPHWIYFVQELPKTETGKISRLKIQNWIESNHIKNKIQIKDNK